jgi:HEAT repeat protein
MGPAAAAALPALRSRIAASRDVSEHELAALWRIGGDRGECGALAAGMLGRPSNEIRPAVIAIAAETGDPRAAAAVIALLDRPRRHWVRRVAAETLPALRPEATTPSLPTLLRHLADPDVRIRRAALTAVMRTTGGP